MSYQLINKETITNQDIIQAFIDLDEFKKQTMVDNYERAMEYSELRARIYNTNKNVETCMELVEKMSGDMAMLSRALNEFTKALEIARTS